MSWPLGMGIDLTYISRIERGKRGVRWHTVLRFLAALDSDLHELADAVDTATKP